MPMSWEAMQVNDIKNALWQEFYKLKQKTLYELTCHKECLRFKKLSPNARAWEYQHDDDCCLDVYSNGDEIWIKPHEIKTVFTDIAIAVPAGYMGIIAGRSGLTRSGLLVQKGIIDRGYRGNVGVTVLNLSDVDRRIAPYIRIAQFYIAPCPRLVCEDVPDLPPSERGANGFGSTGVN